MDFDLEMCEMETLQSSITSTPDSTHKQIKKKKLEYSQNATTGGDFSDYTMYESLTNGEHF